MSGENENRIAGASVVLLCFASGATDVLSYLTLGRIFTSAMTGAAALFFLALVGGKHHAAMRAGIALASYMIGSSLAALLQPRDREKRHKAVVLRRLLIVESIVLIGYCILSALGQHPLYGGMRYGLIVLSALAMGIQTVIARDINEPAIPTVVLNLTLASIMVSVTRRAMGRTQGGRSSKTGLQLMALLAYGLGATATAASLLIHGIATDVLPLGAVLCVLALYQYKARHEQG